MSPRRTHSDSSRLHRLHRHLRIEELEPRIAPGTVDVSKFGVMLPAVLDAYNEWLGQPTTETEFQYPESEGGNLLTINKNKILVDLYMATCTSATILQMEGLGLQVTATGAAGNQTVVEGYLPLSRLGAIAALPAVGTVAPSLRPIGLTGIITTQADTVLHADDLRALGPDGSGITVGILSDSFNYLGGMTTGQSTGDLPSNINILSDGTAGYSTDEGRAMAEIVYDLAPGANLAFHTAFVSMVDFAQGIRDLAGAGCKVITDDVRYFYEPYYQDGIVAQAVTEVTTNWGVNYFSSAGNYADNAYEQTYRGVEDTDVNGITGNWHDFDSSEGADFLQRVTIPRYTTATIVLQWDDPWFTTGGVTGDLDLYVFRSSGTLAYSSTANNLTNNQPIEAVSFTNTSTTTTFDIAIRFTRGSRAPQLMKYISYSSTTTINEYDTNSPTVGNHAAASGGMGVAASPYWDPSSAEYFTSHGFETILFTSDGQRLGAAEVRYAPQITATDGGNTTFFSSDDPYDSDSWPNFYGTSAAAPAAAAVAALLWDGVLGVTRVDIYEALQSTAHDIGSGGFDDITGYGLIDAMAAYTYLVTTPTPGAVDLLDVSDTGISTVDNITNLDNSSVARTLQFTVSGTVDGAFVWLYSGTSTIGSGTAAGGFASITTNGNMDLTDGAHSITARQQAPNKLLSNSSVALGITVDTVAPNAPNTPDLTAASDTGQYNNDDITNDGTPTFSLPGIGGSYWRMFRNGFQASADFETGTTFTEPSAVGDGIYNYELQAFDVAGNASARSGALSVTIDTTPPAIVNTSPVNGTTFRTLSAYEVFFSEGLDPGTVQASDLVLSGVGVGSLSVTGRTIVSATDVRFALSGTPDNGEVLFFVGTMSDIAGNELVGDTRTLYADTLGPTVASTDPESSARIYQLLQYIVDFSEPIASATLVAGDLQINGPGKGTLNPTSVMMLDSDTAQFTIGGTPAVGINALSLGIPVGAVTDLVGNLFQGDTRVFIMDTVSPRVVSTTPASGTLLCALSQYVVDFSEAISAASVWNSDLTIANAPGGSLFVFSNSVSGARVTFNLSGALGNGTVTFTIGEGAILDTTGDGNWVDTRSIQADTISPGITTTIPAANARVNSLPYYEIVFSESILGASVQTTDLQLSGAGLAGLAVTSGTVIGGNTVRFGFSGALTNGAGTFTLIPNALSDLAGNTTAADVRSITADVMPPSILSTNPANGLLISSFQNYIVTFSEDINPTTVQALDLQLSGAGLGTLSVGGVSFDTPSTVHFTLIGAPGNGTVTARLAAGAMTDLAGNLSPLDTRSFTADTIAPAVLSASPASGARFRAMSEYVVRFSEDVDPATVQAIDLVLAGPGVGTLSVTGATVLGGNSVGFSLSGTPGNGNVAFGLARGVVQDLAGNAMPAFSNTLVADTLNPNVATTAPAENQIIGLVPVYVVNFSEPIDPSSVQAGDLLLAGPGLGSLVVDNVLVVDEDTVQFNMTGSAGTGLITATLPAGSITDVVGNPLDADVHNLLGPERLTVAQGIPVSFVDDNGFLVTVTLKGPGTGLMALTNGQTTGDSVSWIALSDTTLATTFQIGAKNGVTTVERIVVNGTYAGAALGKLSGKGVSVLDGGAIDANGGINSIVLGNVGSGVQFTIAGSVNTLTLGTVGDSFGLDVSGKLGTFTAASIGAGSHITASDSITSLKTTKGGLFADVTAGNAINSISVAAGGMVGDVVAYGAAGIGTIKVTGGYSGLIQTLMGGVKNVQVLGGALNLSIDSHGDVGSVNVNGPGGFMSIVSQGTVKTVNSKTPKGVTSTITGGIDAYILGTFSGATTDLNVFTFRAPGGLGTVTARDMTSVVAFARNVGTFAATRDLIGSMIVAGYDIGFSGTVGIEPYGSGNIKTVTVGRNMTQSSIAAGVDPGPNAVFGGSEKVFIGGQWLNSDDYSVKRLSIKGDIGTVKVKGLISGSATYDNYAIEAAGKIGGVSDSMRKVINPVETVFGNILIRAYV